MPLELGFSPSSMHIICRLGLFRVVHLSWNSNLFSPYYIIFCLLDCSNSSSLSSNSDLAASPRSILLVILSQSFVFDLWFSFPEFQNCFSSVFAFVEFFFDILHCPLISFSCLCSRSGAYFLLCFCKHTHTCPFEFCQEFHVTHSH